MTEREDKEQQREERPEKHTGKENDVDDGTAKAARLIPLRRGHPILVIRTPAPAATPPSEGGAAAPAATPREQGGAACFEVLETTVIRLENRVKALELIMPVLNDAEVLRLQPDDVVVLFMPPMSPVNTKNLVTVIRSKRFFGINKVLILPVGSEVKVTREGAEGAGK
jgi:hypothetical protein